MPKLFVAIIVVYSVTLLDTPASASDDAYTYSPAQIAAGAELYSANCARCHGTTMGESGSSHFDLRTFPSSQRSRFFNSVANGKNSMPPWRSVLSKEDIASLFAYVMARQKASRAGID